MQLFSSAAWAWDYSREWIKGFWAQETGTMSVATMIMLIPLLTIGGAGVDFMRFEHQRSTIQACLDNAVLAAANAAQRGTVQEIQERAMQWARAGGCEEVVSATPVVSLAAGGRSVAMEAEAELNTFFLKFAGINDLDVNVASAATNAATVVEISLILDISASMRKNKKIDNLRAAAQNFATLVLEETDGANVSLNVVPYAGHVNPGRTMFGYLQGQPLAADPSVFPDVTSCIEVGPGTPGAAADFQTTGLPGMGRPEVPIFTGLTQSRATSNGSWCPHDDMSIRYAQTEAGNANTAGTLNNWLANLRTFDGTGTQFGVKYGLALLDPSSQPAFEALKAAGAAPDGAETLPNDWTDEGVHKVMVVMTDGKITRQVRPNNPLNPENLRRRLRGDEGFTMTRQNENVASFNALCELAKSEGHNVTIYTIAFEAPSDAQNEMARCASTPQHFFNSNGVGIVDDFEAIANNLSQLRLTQ